jgi:hypothetical protein
VDPEIEPVQRGQLGRDRNELALEVELGTQRALAGHRDELRDRQVRGVERREHLRASAPVAPVIPRRMPRVATIA